MFKLVQTTVCLHLPICFWSVLLLVSLCLCVLVAGRREIESPQWKLLIFLPLPTPARWVLFCCLGVRHPTISFISCIFILDALWKAPVSVVIYVCPSARNSTQTIFVKLMYNRPVYVCVRPFYFDSGQLILRCSWPKSLNSFCLYLFSVIDFNRTC